MPTQCCSTKLIWSSVQVTRPPLAAAKLDTSSPRTHTSHEPSPVQRMELNTWQPRYTLSSSSSSATSIAQPEIWRTIGHPGKHWKREMESPPTLHASPISSGDVFRFLAADCGWTRHLILANRQTHHTNHLRISYFQRYLDCPCYLDEEMHNIKQTWTHQTSTV